MRTRWLWIPGLLAIAPVSAQGPTPRPLGNDPTSIVKDFERRVVATVAVLDTLRQVQRYPPGHQLAGSYSSTWCTIRDVRFDVRQTNSLVSPQIGEVEARAVQDGPFVATSRLDAEHGDRRVPDRRVFAPVAIRLIYARQDGRWVLATGEYQEPQLADTAVVRLLGKSSAGAWRPMWDAPLGKEDSSYCMVYTVWAALGSR